MGPHQGWRSAMILSAALLTVSVSTGLVGCTKSWRSKGIEAQVVDSVTGEPVPDAIVLVNWQIKGMMEGYPMGQLAIFERVTDAQGRFHTPAWGPRRPPPGTSVSGLEPTIRVFKRGYEPIRASGLSGAYPDLPPDVKMMRLHSVEEMGQKYAALMSSFWDPLNMNFVDARCEWHAAPLLFQALVQLRSEFDANGISSNLPRQEMLCKSDNHRDPQ